MGEAGTVTEPSGGRPIEVRVPQPLSLRLIEGAFQLLERSLLTAERSLGRLKLARGRRQRTGLRLGPSQHAGQEDPDRHLPRSGVSGITRHSSSVA